MSNATERLRATLDELNIKHSDFHKGGWTQTQWEAPDGNWQFTYETYDNPAKAAKLAISWFPTPEQAIAAKLGTRTCRFVTVVDQDPSRRHRGNIAECDCCGYRCAIGFIQDERFRFCPNCGRRVVDK